MLVHGAASESTRVFTSSVLEALQVTALTSIGAVPDGTVVFAPTALLCPGLQRLLEVRRVVGLRNPAHSLVKVMNPSAGKSLLVSSYTHPEYAVSMADTFVLTRANAMLLRGTEGEAVADPRRMPQMDGFLGGERILLQEAQTGALATLPDIPRALDAASTAEYSHVSKSHQSRSRFKRQIETFAILSLAKREEEIYIPGAAEPLRLKRRSFALRLLQYVRDEAHRFAQHYHHELRRKSTFDE